jgi:hypothetical protein
MKQKKIRNRWPTIVPGKQEEIPDSPKSQWPVCNR